MWWKMWLEGLGCKMLDLNAMKKTKIALKINSK
jgi:hypothetical protein